MFFNFVSLFILFNRIKLADTKVDDTKFDDKKKLIFFNFRNCLAVVVSYRIDWKRCQMFSQQSRVELREANASPCIKSIQIELMYSDRSGGSSYSVHQLHCVIGRKANGKLQLPVQGEPPANRTACSPNLSEARRESSMLQRVNGVVGRVKTNDESNFQIILFSAVKLAYGLQEKWTKCVLPVVG